MKPKKIIVCMVAICLILMNICALAAIKPGETVTVPISIDNIDGAFVKLKISYDTDAFEFVSSTCTKGVQNRTVFAMSALPKVESGECGSITLCAKDGASAGDYAVSVSVIECWNIDEERGTCSSSGGTISIEKPSFSFGNNWYFKWNFLKDQRRAGSHVMWAKPKECIE